MNENIITRRRFLRSASAFAVAFPFLYSCSNGSSQQGRKVRLDRDNLLIYRSEDGSIRPVHTIDDWLKRRKIILDGMQEVMGPLPEEKRSAPLDFRIDWEQEAEECIIRQISYQGDPDERIPAWLLVPKSERDADRRFPAILSPLGTNQTEVTFSEQALSDREFPRWNDHRDWPLELAQRGYVVLIPPYPHLGTYRPDLSGMGYVSGTMKAIWNNIRGLDLLDQLPIVRPSHYGAIGHSLGGHNSIYTAVFDERLQAVVSSCGFDSYLDYYDGDIAGWAQERYMPRIADYELEEIPFDFHEMVAALAPRHFYAVAPLNDDNFKWQSVAGVVRAASQAYTLYGSSGHLDIDHPDAGHVFPDVEREKAFRLFDEVVARQTR